MTDRMETPPVASSGPCSECVEGGSGVQDGPVDFSEPMEATPLGSGRGHLRSPLWRMKFRFRSGDVGLARRSLNPCPK